MYSSKLNCLYQVTYFYDCVLLETLIFFFMKRLFSFLFSLHAFSTTATFSYTKISGFVQHGEEDIRCLFGTGFLRGRSESIRGGWSTVPTFCIGSWGKFMSLSVCMYYLNTVFISLFRNNSSAKYAPARS